MLAEKDYMLIIGVKECEVYALTQENAILKKELEAARAQLKELARDGNHPV